jgi:hypothetical protein
MSLTRHSLWKRRDMRQPSGWQRLEDEGLISWETGELDEKEMTLLGWLRDRELSSIWSILAMCTL